MARETIYFVQAFNAGRGGNLKADAPIACKTETSALRTAERLAPNKLGVVAFSSTGDSAATGVTVTTTATSASATSTSTLKFSLPSFVACARVSMVLLAIPTMYWNWNGRSSARPGSGVEDALIQMWSANSV